MDTLSITDINFQALAGLAFFAGLVRQDKTCDTNFQKFSKTYQDMVRFRACWPRLFTNRCNIPDYWRKLPSSCWATQARVPSRLASLLRRRYMQEDVCWRAFRVFDKDGSGTISREELQAALADGEVRFFSLHKVVPEFRFNFVWHPLQLTNCLLAPVGTNCN